MRWWLHGLIYLADTASAITLGTGSVVNNAQVIDLLGFGTSNTFETLAAAAGIRNDVFPSHDGERGRRRTTPRTSRESGELRPRHARSA